MTRIVAVILGFASLMPPVLAQTTSNAEINIGPSTAPGVNSEARSVIPVHGSERGSLEPPSPSERGGRPPARWVSAACLARPAWFGKVVVSWEAGTCLTGTPAEDDPDVPLPSPQQLAWIAADRAMAVAERPDLRIAPSRIGLTGLRSFFWLDHAPPTVWATASVPGVVVTAQAEPVTYGWSFGEGPARTTEDIGRAWSRRAPGSISHTYEGRGRYRVSVEVIWQARWRIGSGRWMHLGYFSNSTERRYPVRQLVGRLSRRDYS